MSEPLLAAISDPSCQTSVVSAFGCLDMARAGLVMAILLPLGIVLLTAGYLSLAVRRVPPGRVPPGVVMASLGWAVLTAASLVLLLPAPWFWLALPVSVTVAALANQRHPVTQASPTADITPALAPVSPDRRPPDGQSPSATSLTPAPVPRGVVAEMLSYKTTWVLLLVLATAATLMAIR